MIFFIVEKGQELEKYKIEVVLEDKSLENCAFTASFKQPALEEVLNSLEATFRFEIVKTASKLILKGGKCQ